MKTLPLFQELTEPKAALKAAIAADTEAAGGPKEAAKFIWPESDKPLVDEQRLRNAGLRGQKQLLDYFEIQRLKLAARLRSGASHIHALESADLECKLHWTSMEEQSQEAAACLTTAMQGVTAALVKAQKVVEKLERAGKEGKR
jgi:hypothetical protein